jgi:hypothetical protein
MRDRDEGGVAATDALRLAPTVRSPTLLPAATPSTDPPEP